MRTTRLSAVAVVTISACFAIATSAFRLPKWMGYAALVLMGAALIVLILQTPWVARRFPWELKRKQPQMDLKVVQLAERDELRKALQRQFGALQGLPDTTTAVQLRAWAHGICIALRAAGYDAKATEFEVHLQDDATLAAVKKRRQELFFAVSRMLIWDEFL